MFKSLLSLKHIYNKRMSTSSLLLKHPLIRQWILTGENFPDSIGIKKSAILKILKRDNTPQVELNKTFSHTITGYGFGDLPIETVNGIYKDGRAFSHFIEHWLVKNYPLIHVDGCKDHDFTDTVNKEIIFDEKTFTKGGCKFMPSSMIGTGRTFDKEKFLEKADRLIYCIVSNVYFPDIKIKFIPGHELIQRYPNGSIHVNEHDTFFF